MPHLTISSTRTKFTTHVYTRICTNQINKDLCFKVERDHLDIPGAGRKSNHLLQPRKPAYTRRVAMNAMTWYMTAVKLEFTKISLSLSGLQIVEDHK